MSMEKALIVDDEKDLLSSLKTHFELEGIAVDTLDSPLEALERLKVEPYNVILTDIKMPGMDGVEFMRAAKRLNPLCNIMIITAYSNMNYVVECFSAGACDYFTKPFHDMEVLVGEVKRAIERVTRWRKAMGFERFQTGE